MYRIMIFFYIAFSITSSTFAMEDGQRAQDQQTQHYQQTEEERKKTEEHIREELATYFNATPGEVEEFSNHQPQWPW